MPENCGSIRVSLVLYKLDFALFIVFPFIVSLLKALLSYSTSVSIGVSSINIPFQFLTYTLELVKDSIEVIVANLLS